MITICYNSDISLKFEKRVTIILKKLWADFQYNIMKYNNNIR